MNIDELEGIYGELPEGTVASITMFALPEGEEEAQADSDVEPLPVPKSKKDEASLRAEAASIEHKLTHRTKNPFCPVCQRAKMYAPQARRKGVHLLFTAKLSETTSQLITLSREMRRTMGFKARP